MDKYNFTEEVEKRISGFKRTRLNRISASERLKKYSSRWNLLFFIMNSLAIIMVILSIKLPLKSGFDAMISGCFSIYIILLQYFISNQNYSERSLRFHYEQLEIEEMIYELKQLIYNKDVFLDIKMEYKSIIDKYIISLKNNENHEKIDDEKNTLEDNNSIDRRNKLDITMDNIFIYFNMVLVICLIFLLVLIYE